MIRRAFRARGHEAWSADLLPADDGSNAHFICDDGEHIFRIIAEHQWDLLIVHPPCKFLGVSGMHWTMRGLRDPKETDKAILFAERLWDSSVPKIALENPVSVLSTRSKLGRISQSINPYEFGNDASKRTCLWLKGLPLLMPTKYVEPRIVPDGPHKGKKRWANQTDSGQNKLGPSDDRWKLRSQTYEGIANAMAEQWGAAGGFTGDLFANSKT